MKNIIFILLTIIGFVFPQERECECEEPENIWFKVSNNPEHMYNKLMTLDMSNGYVTTDGFFVYLIVFEKITKEEIVITFPIGHWQVGKVVPKKEENKKEEFDLDEYLKKNKGKGRMINLTTQVGE